MDLDLQNFKVKKPKDKKIDLTNLGAFEKILQMHGGATAMETKYDGYGVLIDNRSRNGDGLRLYSLSKNSWDVRGIPELADDFSKLPAGFYVGEICGSPTHEGFTNREEFRAVSQRALRESENRSSAELERMASKSPLQVRLYDILELKGKVLASLPNSEIRKYLEDTQIGGINPVDRRLIDDVEELQLLSCGLIFDGLEGVVVKDPNSSYSPRGQFVKGSRNDDWIKIKRQTTLDGVVLGLYQTPDRLREGWACSNVLLGTLNS
ncbi:MAG: hypothetical protein ACOCXG_04335, partial [Nanoarchaeota archaeon]